MRGDRPHRRGDYPRPSAFTPHARGSTYRFYAVSCEAWVYPACAGIDPQKPIFWKPGYCLPRMRGDRPRWDYEGEKEVVFTPHARGSTTSSCGTVSSACVYPACAGIDRKLRKAHSSVTGLPRMRGDRPEGYHVLAGDTMFTPHARGSTD